MVCRERGIASYLVCDTAQNLRIQCSKQQLPAACTLEPDGSHGATQKGQTRNHSSFWTAKTRGQNKLPDDSLSRSLDPSSRACNAKTSARLRKTHKHHHGAQQGSLTSSACSGKPTLWALKQLVHALKPARERHWHGQLMQNVEATTAAAHWSDGRASDTMRTCE